LAYSLGLKRQVILDVLAIAFGFVVRASAGGAAIGVPVSQWLLLCTILLALFLALAKRRHEITLLGDEATSHRAILDEYTPYLVDQMMAVVTASTLMGYAFYAVDPDTARRFGTPWLGLTIPFPLYGIFRYLYLVHRRSEGGSPTDLLLADRPLLICVALWTLTIAGLIYGPQL
jgi:4-hydroxybenzoate polyprenyltransferase